jgi:hypothetical protein
MLYAKEISEILAQNEEAAIILEDLQTLTTSRLSMSKIKELDATAFNEQLAQINNSLEAALSDEKIERIADYEKIATQLHEKYRSESELATKSREAQERFLTGTGDYNDFMLSKLYELARMQAENGQTIRADSHQLISDSLAEVKSEILAKFADGSIFLTKENSRFLAEDLVTRELSLSIGINDRQELNSYQKKAIEMAIWAIKFEVKKVGMAQKARVLAKACEYGTFECQKKISDHLKTQEISRGIERMRTQKLRHWEGMVTINLDGHNQISGREAFNFVMK